MTLAEIKLAKKLGKGSRFLRSSCCDARICGFLDFSSLMIQVVCARCGREAGTPGLEDLESEPDDA